MKLFFLLLMLSTSWAHAYTDWESWMLSQATARGYFQLLPAPANFKHWWQSTNPVEFFPHSPFEVNASVADDCQDRNLYPSDPIGNKKYHAVLHAPYDQNLPADSGACLTPSRNGRFCLRSDEAMLELLSDTYVTGCGKFVRGYWIVAFTASEDGMGTLSGLGRVIMPDPTNRLELLIRGTYSAPIVTLSQAQAMMADPHSNRYPNHEFVLVGELYPGDSEIIRQSRANALKRGYKLEGKLWKSP